MRMAFCRARAAALDLVPFAGLPSIYAMILTKKKCRPAWLTNPDGVDEAEPSAGPSAGTGRCNVQVQH